MVNSVRKYLFKVNNEGTNLTPDEHCAGVFIEDFQQSVFVRWVITTYFLLIKLRNVSNRKFDFLMRRSVM